MSRSQGLGGHTILSMITTCLRLRRRDRYTQSSKDPPAEDREFGSSMVRIGLFVSLLIVSSGCCSVSVTAADPDDIVIEIEGRSADWVTFEAEYWHAPVRASTSTKTFFDPDEKIVGRFSIAGSIDRARIKSVQGRLYSAGLFGKHPPRTHSGGLLPGTIRRIRVGSGTPPKGSLDQMFQSHHWVVDP